MPTADELFDGSDAHLLPDLPPEGHPLRRLGARLGELLDSDQWNECEPLLVEAWRQSSTMLSVLSDLQESASYWSEYDVPLGIVDRINSAIAKATELKA